MKIAETKPASSVAKPARAPGKRPGKRRDTAARAAAWVSGPASTADIPENALTPKVRAAIANLTAEVERLRRELRQAQTRVVTLERQADQDSLVPVANRRAFVRELSRTMSFAERYGVGSGVLYFDINGMKEINDTHGHAAGDAALVHVAAILVKNVRKSDAVGRLGGDEFGIILAQSDQPAANTKAAALAAAVEAQPLEWKGKKIPLSLAYGAHVFEGGDNVDKALDAADRAMYARKQQNNGGA